MPPSEASVTGEQLHHQTLLLSLHSHPWGATLSSNFNSFFPSALSPARPKGGQLCTVLIIPTIPRPLPLLQCSKAPSSGHSGPQILGSICSKFLVNQVLSGFWDGSDRDHQTAAFWKATVSKWLQGEEIKNGCLKKHKDELSTLTLYFNTESLFLFHATQ